MINLLFLLISFSYSMASSSDVLKQVLESQSTCQNFVRFDDVYLYLGFGAYKKGFEEPRFPIPGLLRVVSIANPRMTKSISTDDSVIDVIRVEKTLYVLTYSAIEEWNVDSWTRLALYPTYLAPGPFAYKEHARSFAKYKNQLVIAHGRLGVSIFNIDTKHMANQFRLTPSQLPKESMATGIVVVGKSAYVLMDSFSLVSEGKPPFQGIVVLDLETQKVIAEVDGMDPGADAISSDGKKILVSFMGSAVWKYSIDSIQGRSLPEPENRVWKFLGGNPTGRASMDEKYYYTCFSKSPKERGGAWHNVPAALDRKILMLD